jgi:hypothetical protein
MGQSNMYGFGSVKGGEGGLEYAVYEKGLYPYLIDNNGNWSKRKDVRYVRVETLENGQLSVTRNQWLRVVGNWIGPEFGIGHVLGEGGTTTDAPVLLLKSCVGNRALGWDLLPPGSKRFEFVDRTTNTTYVYAGYHDSSPRWVKGTKPTKDTVDWYAGIQYDRDVHAAKQILQNIGFFYPGAKEYQIMGFFWWQGDRDSKSYVYSSRYEKNLVQLIQRLRVDFDAPHAKFVCASLGQTKKGSSSNGGKILDAILAVDGRSEKYQKFKNNVASVYTYWLNKAKGGSSQHYDQNAETFMNVGEAMGNAMIRLLREKKNRSRGQHNVLLP